MSNGENGCERALILEEVLETAMQLGGEEDSREREWVRAARNGDHLAFNRLVLKNEKRIYGMALRMLGNPEEAAETTQEVFMSAFRSLERFQGNAKFSTWIFRIAVNRCISKLRSRPPLQLSIEEKPESTEWSRAFSREGGQEAAVFQEQRRQAVLRSLRKLSDEQRTVLELKFFQENTFEEIGSLIQVPVSTVKSRFYAALENLKTSLRGWAEGSDVV
jgi:RNA polymerase sigma-70 factor, ECF subfamily